MFNLKKVSNPTITLFISILFLSPRQVDFFWINRDQKSFEWFVKLLSQLEIEQAEHGGAMSRWAGELFKNQTQIISLPSQVPGHAHVRHLRPPEDRHEGCGSAAGPRPAPREGLS